MIIYQLLILFSTSLSTLVISDVNLEALFDSHLLTKFEKDWESKNSGVQLSLLSKLGKIAFYSRLYRAWIFTPAGKKGFQDRFPEPKVAVHPDIIEHCTRDLKECIDRIYESIQDRTPFLFPGRDQMTMEDFELDEERFREMVSDTMFGFDISVAYLMCYLTKNQLSFLRSLPFCTYGFEEGQKSKWPSSIFIDSAYNLLLDLNGRSYEPIDYLDTRDFICADESFCPDPCCSRSSNRTTFCAHEICREKDFRRSTIEKGNVSDIALNTQHSCRVDNEYNSDFKGLTLNKWNVSCTCKDDGYIFRFDTQKCVDINECDMEECPGPNEECINRIGSYSCECMSGYYRVNGTCSELSITKKSIWRGIAHAPPKS